MTLSALRSRYPSHTVELDGVEVEIVRSKGDGAPLLMLPGAQGTAEIFYKQILAWGAARDIVSVTYPPWTDGPRLAKFVSSFCGHIGWTRFDVIGTSLGGYIAQLMGVESQSAIDRMVVGNSFVDPRPVQAPERLQALQSKSAETVKEEALARVAASPDGELKEVQRALIGERQSAECLKSRMLAVQMALPISPLAISDDRLLLLESADDPMITPEMRHAVRSAYPGSRCVTIQGGGHFPYILASDAYNSAFGSFLGIGI